MRTAEHPFSATTLDIVRRGLNPAVARVVSDARIAAVMDELVTLRMSEWGTRARALGRRPLRLASAGVPRARLAREVAAIAPLGAAVVEALVPAMAADIEAWVRGGRGYGTVVTRMAMVGDDLVIDPGPPEPFVMPPLGERAIVLE